ncbi:3563_t:CDS:1, partial [Paraglomus brasilianum]
ERMSGTNQLFYQQPPTNSLQRSLVMLPSQSSHSTERQSRQQQSSYFSQLHQPLPTDTVHRQSQNLPLNYVGIAPCSGIDNMELCQDDADQTNHPNSQQQSLLLYPRQAEQPMQQQTSQQTWQSYQQLRQSDGQDMLEVDRVNPPEYIQTQ